LSGDPDLGITSKLDLDFLFPFSKRGVERFLQKGFVFSECLWGRTKPSIYTPLFEGVYKYANFRK